MDIPNRIENLQVVAKTQAEELHCSLRDASIRQNSLVLKTQCTPDEAVEVSFAGSTFISAIGLRFPDGMFDSTTPVFTSDGYGTMGDALSKPNIGNFFIMVQLNERFEWLLIGIGERGADLSCFQFENNQLFASWIPERTIGASFRRTMVVWADSCPERLVSRYQELCRTMVPECAKLTMETPIGWNSWDYYSAAISMESMEREMDAINASPLAGKIKYFTLDMGWENAWGDWRPNGRFPKEFREIASIIKNHGFEPGLWIAPMQVEYLTELARFKPQVLLKGADGRPILTSTGSPVDVVGILNLFDDDVVALIRGWFHEFYEAGFRMFKVDYLYRDFLACLSQSTDNQGIGIYVQRMFSAIRSAIGPDARVINCGAPKEVAAGFAEISRTGYDIHNFWGHVRKCTQQIVGHHWQNRLLWVNDPDFAIARTTTNTNDSIPLNRQYAYRPYGGDNDFWMAGPEATDIELKTWLSVVRLCAGSICYSDSIAALTRFGQETLAKLLPPLDAPATPLDMFSEKLPRFWRGDGVLGVFNWGDEQQCISLDGLPSLPDSLRDFWTGENVIKGNGLRLEAHQGTILEF